MAAASLPGLWQSAPSNTPATQVFRLTPALATASAAYVAFAEALDEPLLTYGSRLTRPPGHRAEIVAAGM